MKEGATLSLPKGWEIKKLGEVCEVNSGSTPLRGNKLFWENGLIPWFTIEDIREQGRIITYTNQTVTELALNKLKLFPIDTVLLCCTASVGEYALTKIPITSNQQFNGLSVIDKNQLFPNYLFHFCSTLKDTLLDLSGKTTIDFVSQSKVKEIEIPLPPLPEQQRIVRLLDEAFEKIDTLKANAERNLQNAKELFQSALTEELKPKEGWEEKKLSDICNLKPQKNEVKKLIQDNEIVTFLPMEDLGKEIKIIVPTKEKKLGEVYSSYTYFADNDVLLAKITPCFENGKVGIATNLINGVGFGSSEYIVFRTLGEVISEYIFYFVSRKSFRDEGRKLMSGAVGHKRVSKEWIDNYLIPFPKSLTEQQTIVEHLDALSARCKALENNYQKTIAQCDEMKKAVLAKAFNGEV